MEDDQWKIAFYTHYGSFEWAVMPFGLTNTSTAFQQFINNTFLDLLNVCIVVYPNNILIYSDNMFQY